MTHALGLKRPNTQAERDRAGIRMFDRAAAPKHFPPALDYRGIFQGPAPDQGQVGSCVFWAGLGIFEAVLAKHGLPIEPVSRRALYTATQYATYQASDVGQDQGSTAVDMLTTVKSVGYVPRSLWQELMSVTPDYFARPPESDYTKLDDVLSFSYVGGFDTEDQATYVQTCKAALMHNPVLIGGAWAQEFEEPGPSGDLPSNPTTDLGGHERRRIGWDDNHVCLDGSRGAWLDLNSWGPSWTNEIGQMWTPYNMASHFVARDIYCMTLPTK